MIITDILSYAFSLIWDLSLNHTTETLLSDECPIPHNDY